MTGEERRRRLKEQMKEAYKRDLRQRKEILEQAKRLRTSRKLNDAITGITGALNDDSDDWIEKLNQESALTEARMEVALDAETQTTEEIEKLAQAAEVEKFSAEEMVRQMKRDMGLLPKEEPPKAQEPKEKPTDKTPPKKTLGDF
ncbi:MAG: hypothetical protein D6722_20905 [Bacteroidetes bacterium]|nr:MAG: hypothetical protein D6722_20905 [Bacteroidota bacterium]